MRHALTRFLLPVASAALVLRLSGLGAGWLPSAAILLVMLLVAHGWRMAAETTPGPLGRHALSWARAHRFGLGIGGLVVLGVSLRLTGVGLDLGHIPPNIDENRLARSVLFFLRTGEIDHTTVEHYPGVWFWVLTGGFLATYLAGLVAGTATRLGDMPVEQLLLVGRVASVLVEASTIAIVGWLGRQLGGRGVGVVAALVMATSPLAVQISAQFRNDSSMVLLATAATAVAGAATSSSRPVVLGLAAALAGLAAGVKYSAVFALVPVLLAAGFAGDVGGRMRRIGMTVVTFGLVLAASNHFLWADVPNLIKQLGDQIVITGEHHYAARANPAWFYVSTLGGRGVGWVWLLLGAALVVRGLSSRDLTTWILLAFPLCYLWFMPQRPAQFSRWVYPLVPSVAVAGSWMLAIALAAVRERWTGRMSTLHGHHGGGRRHGRRPRAAPVGDRRRAQSSGHVPDPRAGRGLAPGPGARR